MILPLCLPSFVEQLEQRLVDRDVFVLTPMVPCPVDVVGQVVEWVRHFRETHAKVLIDTAVSPRYYQILMEHQIILP